MAASLTEVQEQSSGGSGTCSVIVTTMRDEQGLFGSLDSPVTIAVAEHVAWSWHLLHPSQSLQGDIM